MKFFNRVLCLLLALMLPAAGALAAQEGLLGVNDMGFTFFGIDMGDRSLTRDEILEEVSEKSGMEPFQYSEYEHVISNYEPRPECLSGHAGMTSLIFEELDGKLFWAADTLVLPQEDTAREDFYSYETANGLFEDSMEMLAEVYGEPDEVRLAYWDAAEQEMASFILVSEQFFSSVWSMVEQSEYGYLSARYGNAEVRMQREYAQEDVVHTCWLNLAAYEE